MSKPFRMSTHRPEPDAPGRYWCTKGACPNDGYAVTRHGKTWKGDATCKAHAGRLLWQALLAAHEDE